MRTYSKLTKAGLISLSVAFALTGCGGGDAGSTSLSTESEGVSIEQRGTVSIVPSEGNIYSSSLECERGVSTLNSDNITFTVDTNDPGNCTVLGGHFMVDGEKIANDATLKVRVRKGGSKDKVFVNPMTTMVSSAVNNGMDEAEATQRVAEIFNVAEDELDSDPRRIEEKGTRADIVSVFSTMEQLKNMGVSQTEIEYTMFRIVESDDELSADMIISIVKESNPDIVEHADFEKFSEKLVEYENRLLNSNDIEKEIGKVAKDLEKVKQGGGEKPRPDNGMFPNMPKEITDGVSKNKEERPQESVEDPKESDSDDSGEVNNRFQMDIWADNWFEAYLGESLIVQDPISITTERSFNAESRTFYGEYPLELNFIVKDFKENDTGLEYIGEANQQIGDGGFIMQVKVLSTGEVVGVSNSSMQCKVIHTAPLNRGCVDEINPVAGVGVCQYSSETEPTNWKSSSYNHSSWDFAKEYSEGEVSPKDGYNQIDWDESAKLVWSSDLELDNTLLCTLSIEDPRGESTPSDDTKEDEESVVTETSRCETIKETIAATGFSDVSVSCDSNYAYITSDTVPEHDLMNGITGTNEQVPVPAQGYSAPIKLNPSGTSNMITIDAALGVAVNGVPIYDYSSQGTLDVSKYDPNADTYLLGQLDNCGGHAGRGDDYHYHARPTCMIDAMENKKDALIIGWGYDGYPIYDLYNPDGTIVSSGELDICNGQEDSTFGYRYHTSTEAPYVPQCLRGDVDESKLPRVAPMRGRTVGTPPQGGVQNLKFTETNGVMRMEYTYSGGTYYIQYEDSDSTGCYIFETKTVTDGGKITTGEFCR